MLIKRTIYNHPLVLVFILLTGLRFTSAAQSAQDAVNKSMDETAHMLLTEAHANSVSIGVLKGGKVYTRHYGEIDKGKGNKATNETLFEIASVTKTFTGTLVAQAVLEGKINLDDDIRKFLPGHYPNLEYKGNPIKIKDLITHKSGIFASFPNYGSIMEHRDDSTAFKVKKIDEAYTRQNFMDDLKTVKPDTLAGTVYRYSALGPELSAYILEQLYQKSFETLLNEFILKKAAMDATKLYVRNDSEVANGYNNGVLMPKFSDHLWGAAGFLKSTMTDLIKYMKFELDTTNQVVVESHRKIETIGDTWMGYFWEIRKDSQGNEVYWKHGGAMGTQNVFVVYPKYQLGFSVIVNESRPETFDNLSDAIQELEGDLKPFGKKSIASAIRKKCLENIDAGISYYKQLKQKMPEAYNFADESELNRLGYSLMNSQRNTAAIQIFKLNVSEFPKSGNAYDSLAEAYFNNKEYELSKQNYEKVLALNASNENAKQMIKKIEGLKK